MIAERPDSVKSGKRQPIACRVRFSSMLLAFAVLTGQTRAESNAPASLFALRDGLPCHTATYQPHRLNWALAASPPGMRAIVPHPLMASTIYAIAAGHLHRSDDGAQSWRQLPLSGLPEDAVITALAFRPDEPETIALGTRATGVWLTTDGGATARQIGSKSSGMADASVECLVYAPGDPLHRTLLAGHGRAASGVSRGDTRNGIWTTAAPDYHVFRIIPGNPRSRELFFFAAPRTTPDTMEIDYAGVLGSYWQRLVADTLPTDGAWSHAQQAMFLTTLDKGVLRCSAGSGTLQELGGSDLTWQSVCSTW